MAEQLSVDLNTINRHLQTLQGLISESNGLSSAFETSTSSHIEKGFGTEAVSTIKHDLISSAQGIKSGLNGINSSLRGLHDELQYFSEGLSAVTQESAQKINQAFEIQW